MGILPMLEHGQDGRGTQIGMNEVEPSLQGGTEH
jgi:hypothetical protein